MRPSFIAGLRAPMRRPNKPRPLTFRAVDSLYAVTVNYADGKKDT
jgi:hypothetical protein